MEHHSACRISFYSFQTVSYTVDVYRGTIRAERNPFVFGAFISFFPQLVAGPIERASNLLPQMTTEKMLSYEDLQIGLRWILMGMFKKSVIADSFAGVVNTIYSHPEQYPGPLLMLAVFFFAIQVYGDFSGYSDIATGSLDSLASIDDEFSAALLGSIRGRALAARHISLTSWFRDYIYFPLGAIVEASGSGLVTLPWSSWSAAFARSELDVRRFRLSPRVLPDHAAPAIPGYRAVTRALLLHRIPFLLPLLEWAMMFGATLLVSSSFVLRRWRTQQQCIHDCW